MFEINECICILQSGEQAILAFAHVQFEQFLTFDKFMTSLRHFGDGDPNGCPRIDILVQERSTWEGSICCTSMLGVQIPV